MVFYSVEHCLETQPFVQVATQFETLISRLESKIQTIDAAFEKEKEVASQQWNTFVTNDGEQRQENRQLDKQHALELEQIDLLKRTKIDVWAKALTVVYIVHMRLARRQVTFVILFW